MASLTAAGAPAGAAAVERVSRAAGRGGAGVGGAGVGAGVRRRRFMRLRGCFGSGTLPYAVPPADAPGSGAADATVPPFAVAHADAGTSASSSAVERGT